MSARKLKAVETDWVHDLEHHSDANLVAVAVADHCGDPVYYGLTAIADGELEVLRHALDGRENVGACSALRLLSARIRVLAELHRRYVKATMR